jgi:anaerobic ribonucleoside-triphosphate reductase
VGDQVKQAYGIKVSTILNAADKLSDDLEYICSLVEKSDPEFQLKNAIVYAHAVITLSNHLDFVLEELTQRDLTPDEDMVKLSEKDILTMNEYTEATEEALEDLEVLCGISLKNN